MFIDATSLLPDNAPALHYGIAVADLDRDGAFELAVAGYDGPNRILKWSEGRFVELKNEVLADAQRQAIGLAAADFDGDGWEELYVLNTDSFAGLKLFSDRLFDFDGERWRDLFIASGDADLLNMTAGRSVCGIDRLGSGRYGFFVANYGGPMRLYELTEDGQIVDVAPFAGIDAITGGRSLLSFPFVSSRMDLICGNEGGPNFIFKNRGDGTFEEIAETVGFDDPQEHARGMAAVWLGDDFGIVLGNWEGPHRLFQRQADGELEDIATDDFATPTRVRTVIVADFDNDGYEEILFNSIGGPNRLFAFRDGEWRDSPIGDAREQAGLGTGAAVGDFDRDGRLELIIAHGEMATQPLTYYRTPPNGNHFLRVLAKTYEGAPARGSVVTVTAGDRVWKRVIDAGSGYLCQMEPVAHFGLGRIAAVDRVAVAFPTGHTISIEHRDVDCLVELSDIA
ncbi:MAG: CRTAC1 family protein [Planctomycetota bacterium]|nr:CRTAC1 family protein [Planctomycetaceae bacterium]MDQ3329737.1 CRTAC1 family protein [Planctomycetota bacterium]